MAKRLKLDSYSPTPSAIRKSDEVREMMRNPDADKILDLDNEMKLILNKHGLSVDEKVKLFGQVLAQFRTVQDKIIKNGGTSLIPERLKLAEEDKKEFRDMIAGIVEELLKKQKDVVQENPPDAKKDIGGADSLSSSKILDEGTPEPADGVMATPVRKIKSGDVDQSVYALKSKALDAMREAGVVQDAKTGRFKFPQDKIGEGKRDLTYAKSTLEKALGFIFNSDGGAPPGQTLGAVNAISMVLRGTEFAKELAVHERLNFNQITPPPPDSPAFHWHRVQN